MQFAAGLIEFVLSGMMFLMAGFALASYFSVGWFPYLHNAAIKSELYMGIFAFVAFIFGLAGSVSATERWSLLLSVVGASLIACWGLLEELYTLMWLTDVGDIRIGITFGTIAIFFSLLVIILTVATKEHFKIPFL